jgi:hypothetical protein
VIGAQPRRRGMGRDRELGTGKQGAQQVGDWLPCPAHMEREGGTREGVGRSDGIGCACESRARRTGAGCTAVHLDTRSGGPQVANGPHGRGREKEARAVGAEYRCTPLKRIGLVHGTV